MSSNIVVVSGAGSVAPGMSIGRATCISLAQKGYFVVALDRDLAEAEISLEAVRAQGGDGLALAADVTSAEQMQAVAQQLQGDYGAIHGFIANVGVGRCDGIMGTTAEDFDVAFNVNIQSSLIASQLFIPLMQANGRGAFVFLSSVAGMGYLGYPHLAYSVTKSAVIHFARMLAQEYAHENIRANTVVPGLIDTPRVQKNIGSQFSERLDSEEIARKRDQQVPMGRMGTAMEVAHAVRFLISDEASYITGTELVVDGGFLGGRVGS